jgi:hypothetical protein
MLAELMYADGYGQVRAGDAVSELRDAAAFFPFDHRFRTASALWLAQHAVLNGSEEWKKAALPELREALKVDPTSADLIHYVRQFDR